MVALHNYLLKKAIFDDTIPQADDIKKIICLPEQVYEGHNTINELASVLNVTPRQGAYYADAAEALGLIVKEDGKIWLTPIGLAARANKQKQDEFLLFSLLRLPIIQDTIIQAEMKENDGVTKDDIVALIAKRSGFGESTLDRRATTVMKYLEWVSDHCGIIQIKYDKVFLKK